MVDCSQIDRMVFLDPNLCYKYLGCHASNNFPVLINNCFALVNTLPMNTSGEHWLLVARRNRTVFFYDSFCRPIKSNFPAIYKKLCAQQAGDDLLQVFPPFCQNPKSSLCGIYCILVANSIYSSKQTFCKLFLYLTEEDVLQFVYSNYNYLKNLKFLKT